MLNFRVKIKFASIFIVLLILPSVAFGAVITVGADYPTIAAAIAAASAGDTIKIPSGNYHEEILIDKPNLTLEGVDPKNPPLIDGADQQFLNESHEWVNVTGNIYKTSYSWAHKQVSDIDFTMYDGGVGDRVPLQIYEDGVLLRGYRNRHDPDYDGGETAVGLAGPYLNLDELDPNNDNGKLPAWLRRPSINVNGRFLYKETDKELYVWCADGNNPTGKKYYIPVKFHLITIAADNVTLKNLLIRYSGGYSVVIDGKDNITIDHCFFVNNHYGIWARNTNNLVVSNNYLKESGFWERYWYDDVKATLLGSYHLQIKGFNSSYGCSVFNNLIYGTYSVLAAGQNMKIYHNIMSHCTSVLINASEINELRGAPQEYDHNLRIYDNILHDADYSAVAVSFVSKGNMWVYRNIAYNNKYFCKDGTTYQEQVNSESRGKKYFYHNTVMGTNSVVNSPYTYQPNKKTVYRNNIFVCDEKNYAYYDGSTNYFPFVTGPDTDYNMHWTTSDIFAYFKVGSSSEKRYQKNEFESFRNDTQIETHSLFMDPGLKVTVSELNSLDQVSLKPVEEFINNGYDSVFASGFSSTHEKFSLSDGANAIDKGMSLDGFPDFISGEKNDLGAIEYAKDTLLPPPANLREK